MGSTFRMRFKSVKHNKSHKIIIYGKTSKLMQFSEKYRFSIAQGPQSMIQHNIYVIFIHITHEQQYQISVVCCKNGHFPFKKYFQFLGAKFRQRAKKVMITRPLRRLSSITKPHPSEFEETLFTRISTYSSRSSTQTSRNSSGYKITIAFNKINFSKIFFGIKQIWVSIPQTAQEGV